MLRSNDYYPALDADNTELVTDPIAKVTGNAIVTADGVEREIDVLVVATGFYTTELPDHRARDRPRRARRWPTAGARRAWRPTRARRSPSFPNLFMLVGPNTGQGHTSMIFIIESQVAYVRDAIRTMRAGDRRASSRRQADTDALEPQPAEADGAHRVDHRRLPELVPRRARPQHHAVAAVAPSTSGADWRRSTPTPTREVAAMKTLDDKVVVITGAGSGIGRALALNLARRGSLLALSDVDEAGLAETVAPGARGPAPREVRSDRLDVADRDAFARYALDVVQQFGRVNVVINNAGVALAGDFTDLEYNDIDWLVGVNFWGVVHGTKEFLPHLIASGDGHVVNLSSLFGLVSMPGQSMYNATKYAVRGMTEALREEMLIAGHPVGVTAVHPGGIKTAIARNARVSAKENKEATAELFDEKLARMTPERAAEIIVNGILKNRARVLVGIDAHAMHHLAKLLGSRYQDVVAMTLEAGAPGQGHHRLTPRSGVEPSRGSVARVTPCVSR